MEEMQFDQDALAALEDDSVPFLFLTGEAGSGKTTLVNHWKSITKHNVITVAPTGKAAMLAGGHTIHRFFGIAKPPPPFLSPQEANRKFSLMKGKKRRFDVLVIDEISMVRADVMQYIYNTLTCADVLMRDWGTVLIRVVGDLSQIPPVVKDEKSVDVSGFIRKNFSGKYFFNAPCLLDGFRMYEMKQNYRQQGDVRFQKMLNIIRTPTLWEMHKKYTMQELNKLIRKPDPDSVYICSKNADADLINESKLSTLSSQLLLFEADSEFPGNDLPAPSLIKIKVGARVVMLANTEDFKNGHTGTFLWYDPDANTMTVELDPIPSIGLESRTVAVERYTWDVAKWESDKEDNLSIKKKDAYTQFPLKVGYAMSIHKSQGMSIPKIHVNFGSCGAFDHGMLYVAFSRCVSEAGLSLQFMVRESDFKHDPDSDVSPFITQ